MGSEMCIRDRIRVGGARSDAEAARAARTIGDSTLCKTAFHGGDPNWGRFLCAIGYSGSAIDVERADVEIGGVLVCRRGRPIPKAIPVAARRMQRRRVVIRIDLRLGKGRARVVASDLTKAYVHFNSAYTT